MIKNPNYRLFERRTSMRKPTEDEIAEYRQEANEEEYNERRSRIPRNTDPYYPEAYHIADHTPEEEEE